MIPRHGRIHRPCFFLLGAWVIGPSGTAVAIKGGMTTYHHHNLPVRRTGAQFSLVSILAIVAAIASFFVGAGLGFFLAIAAIVLGAIGAIMAIMPGVRGGIMSVFAVLAGVIGIVAAIVRLVM